MSKTYNRGEYLERALHDFLKRGVWPTKVRRELEDITATAQLYPIDTTNAVEWTMEQPTVGGHYWYYEPGYSSSVLMLDVSITGPKSMRHTTVHDRFYHESGLAAWPGWWYGPLPVPEPAKPVDAIELPVDPRKHYAGEG